MSNFLMRRRLGFLLGLMVLLLCITGCALGEDLVRLHEIGIRYQPGPGEVCLTREMLPPEALRLLGVDEETLRSAMERDELFLICLIPEGGQVSLRCFDKPSEIVAADVFQMQAAEKDQFLSLIARQGRYASGSWDAAAEGFALFSTHQAGLEADAAAVHTLSLSTLYLNRIYALETDIIGRAPGEEDIAMLLSAADRLLLLGAAENQGGAAVSSGPISPPEAPVLSGEAAVMTEAIGGIPLSLMPIPSVVGSTSILLEGETQPGVNLRYAVNGASSSRFKPDDDGKFSVTVKKLEAGVVNEVTVNAYTKDDSSTISFALTVDWQPTPLVLAEVTGVITGDRYELRGATLPGATVQIIRRQGSGAVPVNADGSFSYSMPVGKTGDLKFTVRALASGFRRIDQDVALTRQVTPEEEAKAFRRKIKTVTYAKLVQKPENYTGKSMEYTGRVMALANGKGSPRFLLETEEGQRVICLCESLLSIEVGLELCVLGTLRGENLALDSAAAEESYPALELFMIAP